MKGPGPREVLEHYYALRAQRGEPRPRTLREKPWKHAEAYLRWCTAQRIADPIAFLDYRFQCADHTGYVPKTHQLRSNRLAELWHSFREGHHLEQKHGEKLEERAGTVREQTIKHLRHLTAGHEAFKAPYYLSGQPDLCLAQPELSGGYHPESRYCPTCPKAVECAAQLYREHGFDVVSLRAGRLYALPPEVAAAAVR